MVVNSMVFYLPWTTASPEHNGLDLEEVAAEFLILSHEPEGTKKTFSAIF